MKEADKSMLKGLGIYQVVGGLIGLIMIVYSMLVQFIPMSFFVMCVGAMLYVLSIAAGIYLFKENLSAGKKLSVLVQIFQLVLFAIGGVGYLFISGLKLSIDFNFTHSFFIHFGIGFSQFKFYYTDSISTNYSIIGINIVPVIFIYLLEKTIKKIEREKKTYDDIINMQNRIRNNS